MKKHFGNSPRHRQIQLALLLAVLLIISLFGCAGEPTAEEPPVSEEPSGTKAIVIYFSATGNTKAVAEEIAAQTGADIYEIVPQTPYSDDDLNYRDSESRCSLEHDDESIRPEISGTMPELSAYDTIYLGYPLWWAGMPKIMYTYLDSNELSGKTLLPFCTSASSGMEESEAELRTAEPNAIVQNGLRVSSADAAQCTQIVREWLSTK